MENKNVKFLFGQSSLSIYLYFTCYTPKSTLINWILGHKVHFSLSLLYGHVYLFSYKFPLNSSKILIAYLHVRSKVLSFYLYHLSVFLLLSPSYLVPAVVLAVSDPDSLMGDVSLECNTWPEAVAEISLTVRCGPTHKLNCPFFWQVFDQ